jgi:hypothetical protein
MLYAVPISSSLIPSLWLYLLKNTSLKLRIMQFSPASYHFISLWSKYSPQHPFLDSLCGLVVRFLGYGSGGPGSISGTTRNKSSGSGTGSTQPREYNWGATW